MNGKRHKATAKLVRLLTNHMSIGKFRDHFNLDGPRTCHVCEMKVSDTQKHMVYKCSGWMHSFWKCIQSDPQDDCLKEFRLSSEHRMQGIDELITGRKLYLQGDLADKSSGNRGALDLFDNNDQVKA